MDKTECCCTALYTSAACVWHGSALIKSVRRQDAMHAEELVREIESQIAACIYECGVTPTELYLTKEDLILLCDPEAQRPESVERLHFHIVKKTLPRVGYRTPDGGVIYLCLD